MTTRRQGSIFSFPQFMFNMSNNGNNKLLRGNYTHFFLHSDTQKTQSKWPSTLWSSNRNKSRRICILKSSFSLWILLKETTLENLIYHLKASELVNRSQTECVLPVVTVVIVLIVSIFIANQLMVLSVLIVLIVQVVDPENRRVSMWAQWVIAVTSIIWCYKPVLLHVSRWDTDSCAHRIQMVSVILSHWCLSIHFWW